MSIDGSFGIEYELKRFMLRCPKLAAAPQLDNLVKKGKNLSEEELIDGVAELLLHPRYTIPLVGCFRPIARKIVDRVVSLLHLVPDLTSNSNDTMLEFDEGRLFKENESTECEEVICVINSYVKCERGLRLHELSCLAFSRTLDLVPYLSGSIRDYFKFAPPPFKRIIEKELMSQSLVQEELYLLDAVRVSYRLLIAEPEVFSRLWDWSCFLDLVHDVSGIGGGYSELLIDIRWCAVQILTVVLKMSDTFMRKKNMSDMAHTDYRFGDEEAFACLLRWKEFLQDVSLEKAGWYLEPFGEGTSGSSLENKYSQYLGLVPASLSNMEARWNIPKSGRPFVLTSAVKKSFEMVLLAVSQRWPVLLYGPAGVGKTALISRLAQVHGSQVLSIQMDEQIDGKTLIGSYVCAEQPGEFRWQPGSLTQAILNGLWVVFEDIDKAPADVQSILLPLLEGSTLFLTGHGEAIRVSEGFRLFSTVSSSRLDASTVTTARNYLGSLWRRVMVGPPSSGDLLSIVKAWYPDLESLCGKLIETFEKVNQLAGYQLATSITFSSAGRFSSRDLLKWCKRISGLGFQFLDDNLSAYVAKCIYQEAVDVFATSSSSVEMRLRIMRELAEIWEILSSSANTLYPVDKPVLQDLQSDIRIGRVALQRTRIPRLTSVNKSFVGIRTSLHILERIAGSVKYNEAVLLVGETGTGKTTLVQNLAARVGQKLTVLNLSQQSDIADLLGGFKPMNAQFLCLPLYEEFENLFRSTFSSKHNETFLAHLRKSVSDKNWNMLFNGLQKGVSKVVEIGKETPGGKRKRPLGGELINQWDSFSLRLDAAHAQISSAGGMVFSFVEGVFITALKKGEWILLDEVNLAPSETLQRIIGVLEDESGSLCLAERGDVNYVSRNPNFRIFACMNPATDAGKRDLPSSLRSRFTEYFMDDVLEDEDLILFINQFMEADRSAKETTSKVLNFYKIAKKESEERLQDGANQKPQYSLRSLYRALEYTQKARLNFGFSKAIYDGFSMFFLTMLDPPSAELMNRLIVRHLLDGKVVPHVPFDKYIVVPENFKSNDFVDSYQLTASVKGQLCNLARAIFIGKYPVLLQGPTSSGKTSLVQYLAAITGHEFVRINNHEHTDLQEYLGSYITDATGKLVFQEGVLVKAVRHGYWIVLDELNLAPSDVLEALNRLLDDNRELYVPELCETIRAHSNFMLFATQNPPTFYGGRKMLSRAFRNRFVEIHVDEIPQNELITILEKRCKIAPTYAKKMIDVMKDLQLHRQSSKVFAGKHGFITPRDLFRWADRYRIFGKSYEDLGRDGYYLLAERLRDDKEKKVVLEVLEKHLRIKLSSSVMYKEENADRDAALNLQKSLVTFGDIGRVVWTDSMWRLYFLVERCYMLREPVLLVGETGGGKTTVCQLLSIALGSKLHILNCHQYTETSDFLGGFYPVRERSELASDFKDLCEQLLQSKPIKHFPHDATISLDINEASMTVEQLNKIMKCYREGQVLHPDVTLNEIDFVEEIRQRLTILYQKWCTIFKWQDGPLVQAMKNGDLFLVDEISLADDSVLERLNSVLEPERKLSLAEKGGSDLEKITAHEKFFILATMNPGGDYGKKELSPALRNRFTEIWVPPVSELNELKCIALEKISNREITFVADVMISFWEWFNQLQTGRLLTVRDLLSWIDFINVTEKSLPPEVALLHGAFLVLLDGLSLGTGISRIEAEVLRERCLSFLMEQLTESEPRMHQSNVMMTKSYGWSDLLRSVESPSSSGMDVDSSFGIHPFYIEKGNKCLEAEGFEFLAPTTRRNSLRVLRAMQLKKPVLLEGSPGVGKTSLVLALGKFSGHSVVRINLSEQTDMMDLLGSDLPIESDEGMQFAWSDGILLQALKNGSWVLLDELNLAPQSVLEGLNAILDHRAEVFIPELGHTFKCPSSFRVFACQNPSTQGGGRKGLPKSFLNRFTKVYVDELVEEDHLFICSSLHPSVPVSLLSKLIAFNKRLYEDTMINNKFGQSGSPWEFNLRDIIRSCQIIEGAPESSKADCFLNTVYVQRMRSSSDRHEVVKLYEQVFGVKPFINLNPRVQLNPENLIVGNAHVKRNNMQLSTASSCELKILPGLRQSMETVAQCLHHHWLVLLIGPAASGKTSLIRLMSQLTGNVLNELNLSSATDISELLGCFEQYNAIRHYRSAVEKVDRYMNSCMSIETFRKQTGLISRWLSFSSSMDHSSAGFPTPSVENWSRRIFCSLPLLVEIIENLRLVMENHSEDLDRLLKIVRKLQDDQRKVVYPAKFEWVTGLLIKAIENGEWIVLENANLCNPTVLDRINSLVEQSGSIIVNECGTVEGRPMVLRPHPQFRMFLTVNPAFGEVSRAMRNRGVEIYLMQPYHLIGGTDDENELKDVKRFLAFSNIPGEHLVDAMAKAHLSAKRGGLHHNIIISNLELMRWVQLFQRLLTNGNQALWSLKISFEHTYLSSLGEFEGKDIINEAVSSYLSMHELYNYKSHPDYSLCLPGGWPTTSMVRDFVWYSIETSVRQNCMYLEYLGAQMSSHSFRDALGRCPMEYVHCHSDSMRSYVTDLGILHDVTFPKAVIGLDTINQTRVDVALMHKRLLFAANWTIEQTTETDLKVYLLWFRWLGDNLQGYCSFFSSFLKLLKEELDHSIWNCIRKCRGVLFVHDVELKDLTAAYSAPMLSLEYANINQPVSSSHSQLLANAVKCVELLRVSYQQWHAESEFEYSVKTRCFIPVLSSLRSLEERILDMLVESPFFDVLFELYRKLIHDHLSAWNGLVLSQVDSMLISWRSLAKDAQKLKEYCSNEVELFQNDMWNLERVLSWSLNSQRSLLWAYGGHPFTPSSAEIYRKQQQLLNLCHSIWTRETHSQEQANKDSIETAVSTNPELRFLAMQGVCMSAFIMSRVDEDDLDVLKQMEEMYQMLLSKFHHEKVKLERNTGTNEQASLFNALSSCCVMNTDMLCQTSGLSCWRDTLTLNDNTSFALDMRLLQELTSIVVLDNRELKSGLSRLRGLLESTLKFSLNSSSRPPTDFSPYQKLSWVLDAWTSVSSAPASISTAVLEMWFNWHTSLWKHHSNREKKNPSQHGSNLVPDMLFQPVATLSIDKILKNPIFIRDLNEHSLKLRVASHNLWLSSPHVAECRHFFLLSARSLFQQIILAHEKSFGADNYSLLKSLLLSPQQADVSVIISLLTSSTHHHLKSLISQFFEPLLYELYAQNPTDSLFDLGCAWLRIGGLRYHLLQSCNDVDPAVKKSYKYSQLTEMIASLELDIEVRQECVHLAGCFSLSEADKEKIKLLNNLKAERNRLRRLVVFRSDPGKFKKLRSECDEFQKLVGTPFGFLKGMGNFKMQQIVDQVHNWQETATRFVDRLSEEYSEYIDIIQPVQIAIYEMKLGLSLVLSSRLRNQFLDRVGQENIDVVLAAIYSFMRFPRGTVGKKDVSYIEGSLHAKLSYFDEAFPTYMGEDYMKTVETLVTSATDNNTDEAVSVLQLKAAIHQNILLRVVHSVAEAHFLDNTSFKLLDRMFDEFANLWMKMKIQIRTKEEHDSSAYRFRSRAFDIKDIVEMDVSTLESLVSNEAFSEWQELASEEVEVFVEKKNADEEHDVLEKDWNLLLESMLNEMVNVYNTIFGSTDLLQPAGYVQVSDSDRLHSFLDSYTLGTRVIKDLEGLLCSSLDAKLIPEHILRLCLEHDRNFVLSHLPKSAYNFYKDSNASLLSKMVDPVMNLQQRIRQLLCEWDDHPALQKIVDVIDMILSIPMNTPLAKAMSGLQFLLNRVRNLQETVSKFPLSDQVDPIIALVSSWQKMEFESWPALVDEVQARFDTNAGQLWFPLYSVLWQSHSADSDNLATIRSLEEFIQTSSVGEFRKRLQLVFAFHGHISTAMIQKSNLSHGHEDNVKILYNTFGFYIQFLPIILQHLASNRKSIEAELKELLKLCKWERNEWYMTMETSKRTREKLKKLIQKYTDVLKQPVMLILNQAAAQSGIKTIAAHDHTLFRDSFEKHKQVLDVACHDSYFTDKKRFIWPSTWRHKVDLALEHMCIAKATKSDYPCVQLEEAKGNIDTVSKFIDFQSSSGVTKEEWDQVQYTFEKISTNVIDCGELWKDEKKSLGKRRALSELLKLLGSCGLSKHKEDQSMENLSSRWFLQPSYIVEHLLLKESRLSSGNLDVAALEKARNIAMDNLETDWKTANEYFFKSISSLGHLQQASFKFHKDFTHDQVERSVSYLDHLVQIQKSHRAVAYDFAEVLEHLKKRSSSLQNLFSSSSVCAFSHNQEIVAKCMWRQKQLFDTMCNTLNDECLLLRSVENNHLNNCQSVGAAAHQIRLFLEKFVPAFKKSKELLDSYLLGARGSLISTSVVLYPYEVTKQMEQFVQQNFLLIRDFKDQLHTIRKQDVHLGLAKDVLLDHFEDILAKGNLLDDYYKSALETRNQSGKIQDGDNILRAEAQFIESLRKACKLVVDGFDRVNSVNNRRVSTEEYLGNINNWEVLFASRIKNMQLNTIHDELVKTLGFAGELMNLYGNEETKLCLVEAQLKHLYSLLDLMITFGDGLLNAFIVVHRTLSMVTHALAEIFASLYSQGFGCSTENEEDDNGTQDATGTGMGEGAGVKDISDQIEDEDQLLGTEKGGEEQDALNDVPSKNDKGIEMEQDFNADAFSVSEDSSDDENDDESDEPQLDSAMGETGDDSEIIDEKLQDNKDDENNENPEKNEKYENGPSVKDNDPSGRELRAKEDDVATADEAGELDPDESNKQNDENDDQVSNDNDGVEDMNIDKDEAFSEPTGLKPDEPDVGPDDDIDMNQQDDVDHDEDEATEAVDESAEFNDAEEENIKESPDETVTENTEMDAEESEQDKNTDADMEAQKNDVSAPVANDFDTQPQQNNEPTTQPNNGSNGASMRDVAPEVSWSNNNDLQSDLAPIQGLPNSSMNEISVADSSTSGKLNDEHMSHLPELDPSPLQNNEPNPFRNIGDALDGWKEKAKVSVDLEEKQDEPRDELEGGNEDADEYGFTSGLEKGTAQALGPAAADQVDKNIDGKEPIDGDGDGGIADKKDDSEMDLKEQDLEDRPFKNHPLNIRNTVHDKMEVEETEIPDEAPEVFNPREDDDRSHLESSVHMKRSYMTEDTSQFGQLSVADDDMGMAHNLEDVSGDLRDSATALWRKYELQTTRLSQELAEQLRLVMEPTLASKLQGDYKTGKRINMKKVIPYIASHYRKDKIWLRRTRPNKRSYQVVIAVDDSRSMSENNCGNVAIEALVTVCRAMSQLEVGNLAVASFGKKGNIQLLHDFDQPFTGEAGVKMLSSLTFKQENTIADEPMVDLLKYLNNTLDSAAMNARLPSGQSPLEQLVLIIADGRLHEKENLRRCVRDILSKKRMVAFLLLDNPNESITEVLEASFEAGKCGLVKYMNSFPFPFYVILKDIETLPRTLADLLRQKNPSQHGSNLVPDMLFQPVATLSIDKILKNPIFIRDLNEHSLKLRVASHNLWLSSPHVAECRHFFLLSARSLFQQIILAHEKSFGADNYSLLKSLLLSPQQADVSVIISLLTSSTHHHLKSLISQFFEPLLYELYAQNPTDSLFDLGCAWLRIGGLRYHLLQSCNDVDPAVKKSYKYSQLTEMIASLELDIEVRQECVHLAGCFSLSEADKEKIKLLNNLKAERNRLRRLVVFRSDPGKFKKLRSECDEFQKLVGTPFGFLKGMGNFKMQQIVDQVHNWQETATRFVDRLSEEYSEYIDIIQPVQIAIYEMKLGLSLVLSSRLRNQFLDRVGQENIDVVLAAIYSFMRFPRGTVGKKDVSYIEGSLHAKLSYFDEAFPTYMGEDYMKTVETLVTSATDNNTDEAVSVLQLKAAIHQNILLRVVHSVAEAHFLDNTSFKLLDRMFDEFANLWMKMKIQIRTKEEHDSSAYRFRSRAFDIKDIVEMDVSTLESLVSNEAFSEWQELASEEVEVFVEKKNADEEHDVLEKDWNLLLESMLNEMVNVYNTIFGSTDLLQPAGYVQVSDSDRLHSFLDSYTLGTRVIKDLEGLLCSSLDAKLIPEHILRLCLEHDRNFVLSHLPKSAYNFYKDSNASLLSKMVDPVMNLQQRIRQLLCEWDDHPALQKIVDVIDMILSIPMNTPLAKAMSGLQFLLNRVRNLQETVSKFPLSDQVDPIIALVSSWQKMEFESWPALVDEVQARFDTNAGQLWFPLYSVLWQSHSADSDNLATIRSLEEFIQTSSVGEFRKRLQLVFAFHGHISTAMIQKSNLSHGHEDNVKILYNTFGFYIQFLPIILQHLASNRKSIEAELKELLKLCKWERNEWYMTMETSKRTREKLKKLIQKYTDVLKQPVMLILNQAAAQSGIKTIAAHDHTLFRDSFEKHKQVLDVACHDSYFTDKKRFIWPSTWRHKVDLALEHMCIAKATKSDYPCVQLEEAKGNIDTVSKFIDFQSSSGVTKEEWDQVQYTFEKISTNVIDCGELWKDEKKSLGKRRALSELLKLLGSCGLSKHKEDQSMENLSSRWFLQPSYIVEHLLLKESRLSSGNLDVAALEKARNIAMDNLETDWKTANEYFFKSISSLGHLQQASFKFHKDFTHDQVERSVSYLDHLVQIQKSHRAVAYDFAEVLEHLKKRSSSLQNLFSSSSVCAFSHNQEIVAKCMWRQKRLFDTMCNTLNDECLLLRSVENNHLNNCQSVGAAAHQIRLFLEKFVPAFKKSKELLDSYLLGARGSLISTSVVLYPYEVTKQMEQFVQQNFLLIRDFKDQLHTIRKQDVHLGLAKDVLLDHFEDILAKGNLLDDYYKSALETRNQSGKIQDGDNILRAEAQFIESLRKACKLVVDGFDRVNSVNNRRVSTEEYLGNINNWEVLFASRIKNMQLNTIHDELVKTLGFAGELMNLYGNEETKLCLVEAQLKHLYSLLDLMITFGDGLLNAFIVVHRTLSMVTHALAEIFASLYSQGFGCSTENEEDDNGTQDATGTGMGEGAGVKDISDQIEDEDQLLGTEKGGEEQDALNDVPSKNDKGIEMEQDFNADAFSVSEDSSDDENDDESDEPQLDSAMGETGDDSEIIDEKLQDNKDDENNENPEKNEKYENGPSVKDNDPSGRELRAKEDDVATADEAGELDPDESNKQNDENDDQVSNDNDGVEDMNIDKDEAFSEPTGLKPDEPDVGPDDDIDMNQQDDVDHDEDEATEAVDESAEFNDAEEENIKESPDETVTENTEMDAEESEQDKNTDADMEAQKNDVSAPVANDFDTQPQQNNEPTTQPNNGSNGASMRDVAPEVSWSNNNDLQSDLAPIQGLPNSSMNEISVADSSTSGKLNDEHMSHLPELDPSPLQNNEPNPFRNIGDALDGWKEKAKVSVDLEEKQDEPRDELEGGNEDADEYGFTSGLEKGTAQALGPAAADQVDKNIDGKEPIDGDGDGGIADKKDDSEMDLKEQDLEDRPFKNHPLNIRNTVHDKMEVEETEIPDEAPEVFNPREDDDRSHLESSVHMKRSYMTEDTSQFGQLSVADDDMGMAHNLEDVSGDLRDSATALWRKYELQTTRLSQELAEQLRLVMEPTLASKLQGDYKTGKRINMKKVIPYIASHYRKDKIWLRRTRPNKRSYQVVIAVDDSRSMSENNCGNVAIEALVTVCRAMSQLEVGNLAVASFGKKGNIQLLHDFDQPFTGEAGVKMLSSLTFKQENTIADEPMVDLLKYLNNTLDSAAMNARLPSGQSPLEQLVLIIADGRLHEKENLRRCVRDILSKKRMVAFLLLDNPNESITEVLEASFEAGKCGLVKYMNSFPFPFYVILKDIETLPRTLADLLRQWFELMQHSGD